MEIKIRETNDETIVIVLKGELDTAAAQQFATEMNPVMAEANKHIILDFTELEYVSSAGMRTILLLNKNASSKGGKVIIKGMSEEIKQIFQMVGLDRMIEIL